MIGKIESIIIKLVLININQSSKPLKNLYLCNCFRVDTLVIF